MEIKEKIYTLRRDLILLLLGIFLSFSTQVAYDSVKELPVFQGIPLIIRTDVLAVTFGLATIALLAYFFWNEVKMIKEKNMKNPIERVTERNGDLRDLKDDLETWTDALEELSEIEDSFKTNIEGKTLLDVGTDAVKPLYIALKFNPRKIVGINEELRPFVSDIELKSKTYANTEIRFYSCSFFDEGTLRKIQNKEGIKKFDFVLVSKTLHHLRDGKCIAKERDEQHKCREDEDSCIYGFEEQSIFPKLFELGEKVIIYEFFDAKEEDNDKIKGRGGYFTVNEWKRILQYLSETYEVKFIRPASFQLCKEELDKDTSFLRQVDIICFCNEKQKKKS